MSDVPAGNVAIDAVTAANTPVNDNIAGSSSLTMISDVICPIINHLSYADVLKEAQEMQQALETELIVPAMLFDEHEILVAATSDHFNEMQTTMLPTLDDSKLLVPVPASDDTINSENTAHITNIGKNLKRCLSNDTRPLTTSSSWSNMNGSESNADLRRSHSDGSKSSNRSAAALYSTNLTAAPEFSALVKSLATDDQPAIATSADRTEYDNWEFQIVHRSKRNNIKSSKATTALSASADESARFNERSPVESSRKKNKTRKSRNSNGNKNNNYNNSNNNNSSINNLKLMDINKIRDDCTNIANNNSSSCSSIRILKPKQCRYTNSDNSKNSNSKRKKTLLVCTNESEADADNEEEEDDDDKESYNFNIVTQHNYQHARKPSKRVKNNSKHKIAHQNSIVNVDFIDQEQLQKQQTYQRKQRPEPLSSAATSTDNLHHYTDNNNNSNKNQTENVLASEQISRPKRKKRSTRKQQQRSNTIECQFWHTINYCLTLIAYIVELPAYVLGAVCNRIASFLDDAIAAITVGGGGYFNMQNNNRNDTVSWQVAQLAQKSRRNAKKRNKRRRRNGFQFMAPY